MSEKEIYSELILDLYRNPVNFGSLGKADISVEGGNPLCGDEVKFELRVSKGKIEEIMFSGHGCAISRAAESLLTEMVKGKTLHEVEKLTEKDMFGLLGNVIQTRVKCALLGLVVLKEGIRAYGKNPERKAVVTGIRI